MARRSVETVMAVYAALARRDTDALATLTAPQIEIRQSRELPWGGVYQGMPEAMGFFRKVTTFLDSHVTVERLLDAGDCVAVVGRTSGSVRATATPFDVPLVHLWEVCDGKVVRLSVYLDNLAMLPGVICEIAAAA